MQKLKTIFLNDTEINIIMGDITEMKVDAIVNAANSFLKHGGGVAGAIGRKGGPVIQKESDAIGYVPVGKCAITSGGQLKAPYVIHAVGPRFGEGDEENKLRSAVKNVLNMATSKAFKSIAFPAISAGIFGFPKNQCAHIIVEETLTFIKENKTTLKAIIFCLIDEDIIDYFIDEMQIQERGTQ
jgi:O-acetyl-ADP-ribose deacetylase (regulator of RNase III)